MTRKAKQAHGKRARVYSGNRPVRGLYERKLASGVTVYDARIRVDGRERKKAFSPMTKTDAMRAVEDFRVSLVRGDQQGDSLAATVGELAEEYIAHLRSRIGIGGKREVALGTVLLYEQQLRDHVCDRLADRRVDELNVADLRRLLDRLTRKGLAPSTITSVLFRVSGLMRYAIKQGLRDHNPVRDLDRDDRPGTKRQTEPRYLTEGELDTLIAKVGLSFRLVIVLCTFAALRVSEALGLRWSDIDFDAETITVSGQIDRDGNWKPKAKTDSSHAELPMLPVVKRALQEHRRAQATRNIGLIAADQLVNVTNLGKVQSRRNTLRALHKAGEQAGLNGEGVEPVGLHDLRHSMIALALANPEVAVTEVTRLARHANARTTLTIYAGIAGDGTKSVFDKLSRSGIGR